MEAGKRKEKKSSLQTWCFREEGRLLGHAIHQNKTTLTSPYTHKLCFKFPKVFLSPTVFQNTGQEKAAVKYKACTVQETLYTMPQPTFLARDFTREGLQCVGSKENGINISYSGQEGMRPRRLQIHFPPSISDEARLGYLRLKQSKKWPMLHGSCCLTSAQGYTLTAEHSRMKSPSPTTTREGKLLIFTHGLQS